MPRQSSRAGESVICALISGRSCAVSRDDVSRATHRPLIKSFAPIFVLPYRNQRFVSKGLGLRSEPFFCNTAPKRSKQC